MKIVVVFLVIMALLSPGVSAQTACVPDTVPIGQQNPPPADDSMPLTPAWCNGFTSGPSSFVSGSNDWVDDFSKATQMQSFNDGENGYRVFNNIGANPVRAGIRVQHFINNGDWFDDTYAAGQSNVGSMLRPARSFTFENGKLVVEADVAAGEADYADSGDSVFPELDISMAPQPTGHVVDSLYGYGQFGGAWTIGCRLHNSKSGNNPVICAVESAASTVQNNAAVCNAEQPSRVMEISDFEVCGSVHSGGSGGQGAFRTCPPNNSYDLCLDRFRMELSKTGLVVYVNGQQYFEDSGWDAAHQLPDSMTSGGQVYVYYTDWVSSANSNVFRFNWQRLAINPHNADGTLAPPSASPTFNPGGGTSPTPTATPTSTRTSTSTPTPTMARTSTPTPTATASKKPGPCWPPTAKRCR